MFKKIAAETLGLSDIGQIISPSDYDKVDADDYLFHEDGEKIFFLIKSKKDEYCFTNLALIHVDGDSAISSKRIVKRYEYISYKVSQVFIETAGNIDLDIELKFTLDDRINFSIDVNKNSLESLKDIYKALITIGKLQMNEEIARQNATLCLQALASMYKLNTIESEETIVKHYHTILVNFNTVILERYKKRDFSNVFEKYIRA
ncbi:PH domain-containing protein [Candidatus Gracilibacteria bacterium]|jgi:Bacterial PH domain|nr:PH domain-containing protein [Candidatus Gracilibacteria bacterium]NJM87559.1 PH domain-containing protein [Hydrococcus sp. RU_2_2]NJP19456.1 PH domain-containing protein [Hydrococcus sp. CRU_1_1]